jgi:3D (Asp-Asp-Asp) domain-containing protein
MRTKTIRQLISILIPLLIFLAVAAHIIQDQWTADKCRRLTSQNAELKQTLCSLTEQLKQDETYISDLNRKISELRQREKSDRGSDRPELLGTYTITAYCSCEECCGKRDRPDGKVIGAAGVELTPGVSVAAPLPFGTELMIDGRRYAVQDRAADWIVDRYGGKIIDIYFSSHEAALKWGKQVCEVYAVR